MPTAAIYARFSTDRQDRSSIEDQIRTCRAWAEAHGLAVVATYSDEATSGSIPVRSRAGGTRMHDAALAGAFDALVVEGLDRLARDQVEQDWTQALLHCYIYDRAPGWVWVARPLTIDKDPSDRGARHDPTFSLTKDQAQQFIDALWSAGLRPSEGSGSAGSLAATQRHLEDMRKIAFSFITNADAESPSTAF